MSARRYGKVDDESDERSHQQHRDELTSRVGVHDGVIVAIGVEVKAADDIGRDVVDAVGVQKSACARLVVARLQIVQARLHVVVVAAIAEGIDVPDERAARVFRAARVANLPVAPGVIHIFGDDVPVLIYQRDDVPQKVLLREVQSSVVGDGGEPARVVGVEQGLAVAALFAVDAVAFGEVGRGDAVRRFALAHAACVVGEKFLNV